MSIPKLNEGADVAAVLEGARVKSEAILETLRSAATELLGGNPDIIIGVNGSVARREATSGSDVDLFFLTINNDLEAAKAAQQKYREHLAAQDIKMPADGGVFERPLQTSQLTATVDCH